MTFKQQKKGFILLEVMCAFCIIAFTFLIITITGKKHLNNLVILEEKMQAGWVADNQLALLLLARSDQKTEAQNGKMIMGKRTWYWRVQHLTEGPLLHAIDLEVSLQSDFSVLSAALRTYVSPSLKVSLE